MAKSGKTFYSKEIAQEICLAIATSNKGIRELCSLNDHWPNADTIFVWRIRHPEFSAMYADAKRHQVEYLVDELLVIADDAKKDSIETVDEHGNITFVCNKEWLNRSRLRIDTRKWIACKLAPKLYGDKTEAKVDVSVSEQKVRDVDSEYDH